MTRLRHYLDHNATTPVRPEVLEAMLPYLRDMFGNPSSKHTTGELAREAIEQSRDIIAGHLGADPVEIVFTGSGTEADNLALRGVLAAAEQRTGLVTTAIEHKAVLATAEDLAEQGAPVAFAEVDKEGRVNLDTLRARIDGRTALVSVMHANNETGVIQDIAAVASIAHEAGALFHTDAVQTAGKLPIDVRALDVDLLSLSAHKLNAPKGIGALYVRSGVNIRPILTGGGHERGLRPGTENVAGIAGMAVAFDCMRAERDELLPRLGELRDRLEQELVRLVPGASINGREADRLPTTSNISFPGIPGEVLVMHLDMAGIEVSTGSACTTGSVEPSHVLVAMGVPGSLAQGSIRFSLGWGTESEAVDHVIAVLPRTVSQLREISGWTP